MSKTVYTEVSCDQCGQADFYIRGTNVDKAFRKSGGIATKNGKHFCDKDCREEWRLSSKQK
jgi:hypothetical protein